MNILEEIAERTRVRIAEEEAAKPLAQLRKEADALWEKELAQGVESAAEAFAGGGWRVFCKELCRGRRKAGEI